MRTDNKQTGKGAAHPAWPSSPHPRYTLALSLREGEELALGPGGLTPTQALHSPAQGTAARILTGVTSPPGATGQCPWGGWLLAPSGQTPGMLPNTLQGTGQPSREPSAPNVSGAAVEQPRGRTCQGAGSRSSVRPGRRRAPRAVPTHEHTRPEPERRASCPRPCGRPPSLKALDGTGTAERGGALPLGRCCYPRAR